jgi:hypothetical protein
MNFSKALAASTVASVVTELAINLALPYIIFFHYQPILGDVRALIASSAPPILWSLAVSLFVITGIVLGLLAIVGGGSAKFLQLRENLVTGFIGIVFLGSALIRKPIIFELVRAVLGRQSAERAAEFSKLSHNERFRAALKSLTIIWGVGLLAQTVLACVLVYVLTIRTYLLVSPLLTYATGGVLALVSSVYFKRTRSGLAETGK